MRLFTANNCDYTQPRKDDLNSQWDKIVDQNGLDENTEWYYMVAEDFVRRVTKEEELRENEISKKDLYSVMSHIPLVTGDQLIKCSGSQCGNKTLESVVYQMMTKLRKLHRVDKVIRRRRTRLLFHCNLRYM